MIVAALMVINATTRRLASVGGPSEIAEIGAAPKGIVLFTHLRRCGGTFLEEGVLKPYVRRLGTEAFLCREGDLARFHRHNNNNLKHVSALAKAGLVWRHCPYGIHSLLGPTRPYVYATMVRSPGSRMTSWYAYCDRYSPDKCKTGRFEGGILGFYEERRKKYAARSERKTVGRIGTFHEDWLEYALDDNYATRMICGGEAHDAPVPVGDDALECAIDHLTTAYAFVGVLERRDESICVLTTLLGAPRPPDAPKLRGPTTKSAAAPPAFLASFKSYLRLDDRLYAKALDLLDAHLDTLPSCRRRRRGF